MKDLLPGIFLICALAAPGQPGCVIDKDRDGIKVFICSTGDNTSTVRVELLVNNATISELEQIIDSVPAYVNWQYQVTEASVLERNGPNEVVYRTRLSTPAFIDDREMIVRLKKKTDQNGKQLRVTIVTDPYPYPLNEDLVRVPSSNTTWNVVAVNEKTLHITYTLSMDPGGSLPDWVVKEALSLGPFETFSKLKKMLEQDRRSASRSR